jgi:hypothetical protein
MTIIAMLGSGNVQMFKKVSIGTLLRAGNHHQECKSIMLIQHPLYVVIHNYGGTHWSHQQQSMSSKRVGAASTDHGGSVLLSAFR